MRLLALSLVTLVVAAVPARASSGGLTLDGPGATRRGHQVTFTGRFADRPHARVGIYLGSSIVAWTTTSDSGFFVARPHLFTSGDYRARAAGAVSAAHHVRNVRPQLREGTTGDGVRSLVQRLAELGYAVHSPTTSEFTGAVRQSVYAFQKAQGLSVDGIVGPETRAALRTPQPVEPRFRTPGAHIEVDTIRQLVLVVRDGAVKTVVNTSTAGIPGYHTPHGTFHVFRRVRGIDTSPLGKLYDPLYFYRGYAIHGSTNVPPHPASHGCVRVPIWEAARLFESVPHGETVYVY
jgi:lipoprotein-anchoring transpeptidase ErfK/SrfK